MKKIVLIASVFCCAYVANASESPTNLRAVITSVEAADWVKTPTGIWESAVDGKKVFYKINATDGSLWTSADNQKWEAVKENTWQDKNGKWLKLENNELKSSTDGKTWSVVLDSQWESANGTWYKFDKDLVLWSKSEKM
jgi:hypothetical protein